jgi:hypothetical protein
MNAENTGPETQAGAPPQQGNDEKNSENRKKQKHDEEALDEGLEESFPASDPVAVGISKSPGKKNG